MKLLIKERGKFEGIYKENVLGSIRAKNAKYEFGYVRIPISAAQRSWLLRVLPRDPYDEDDVDIFNTLMGEDIYWRKAFLTPSTKRDKKGRTIWCIVYDPNNIYA